MKDLHPHWHSTGDDESAVSPASVSSADEGVHVSIKPASRMPAAVMGILIFTVVGLTMAGGWDAIRAQVDGIGGAVGTSGGTVSSASSSSSLKAVEIHITMTQGFQPASVTVKPGQTITWINDQSIPHILTSQTLRDANGAYLNTPAIFPSSKESFTVGSQEVDKQHTVTSTTDAALVGTVIVSAAGATTSSASSRKAPLGSMNGVNLPSGQGSKSSTAGTTSSAGVGAGTTSTTSLPPPATVDLGSAAGTGVPAANPSTSGQPTTLDSFAVSTIDNGQTFTTPNVIAPDTPSPNEQPHTGPGLWAVCIMSMAVLWRLTRKYFVPVTR